MTIATNCNQIMLVPPNTPKKSAPASEPPPRVMALCNQPGPDKRTNAPRTFPSLCAFTRISQSDWTLSTTAALASSDRAWLVEIEPTSPFEGTLEVLFVDEIEMVR